MKLCGISGFNWEDTALIKRMTDKILHRGPDDGGLYVRQGVSLGNRRLSIQDLSPAGHMPMTHIYRGRQLAITFNGEIYNFKEIKKELEQKGYTFYSGTDTEVIMIAYLEWGEKCCERFNGMWSFAIHDPKRNLLFMSRDRFGEKPFYYFMDRKRFIFGSEIKQLLEHDIPRKVNRKILSDYLYFSFVDHTNDTFFEGVHKLPAGHYATYDLRERTLKLTRYYSLKIADEEFTPMELRTAVKDGTESRMVSDVPVSISLSGGIDSSAICAMIPLITKSKIMAFSTSPGKGKKGDETAFVEQMVRKYPQIKLIKSRLATDSFGKNYRDLIYHMDEPFFGYNPYVRWEINRNVRAKDYKVLLMGEASDEIFGGYYPASVFYLKDLLKGFKPRFLTEFYYCMKQPERKLIFSSFVFLMLPKFMRKIIVSRASGKLGRKFGVGLKPDSFQRMKSLDVKSYKEHLYDLTFSKSLPHLLNCDDKMAMAHSVENRSPFLDHRLVEMAFRMDVGKAMRHGFRKYPLRESMEGLIPDSILFRRKKDQFAAPVEEYLKGKGMGKRIHEIFTDAKSGKYFSPEKYLEEYDGYIKGRKADTNFILKGLWIEEWMRMFNLE